MSGGVVQLVAVGPQDAWLTGKPEVSFYRSNYRRYTHFANSIERQVIQGVPIANGISTIRFEKKGDLLSYVYLTARDSNGASVVGLDWSKVIDKVELMIGGQIVDTHDFEYMTDIEPIVGAQTYSQRYLNLNSSVMNNQKASFFPLKFFFCKEWTLCLPLIGLQFHDVEVRITWSSYLNQTITFGTPTNINATQVSQLSATSAAVTLPAGATGTLTSAAGPISTTSVNQVFLNGTLPNNSAVAIATATTATTASVTFPYGFTSNVYAGAPPLSVVSSTTAVIGAVKYPVSYATTAYSVTAISTAGVFTCSSTVPFIGQTVAVSGSLTTAGAITGYSNPTNYYVIAINSGTSFTLSATLGGSAVTGAGASDNGGLTYTPLQPTASTLALKYNASLSTVPNAGEFALGLPNINSGSNTWQGAFVTNTATASTPIVTVIPSPVSVTSPTVTSNIVFVQPVYSTPLVVAASSGASCTAVAGSSVAITSLTAANTPLLVPGSAVIYQVSSPTLLATGVSVTGANGQFTVSPPAPLFVGQTVTIAGTAGGTGAITGYSNPTTYYIIATNGSTTFTLSATFGGTAIGSQIGTLTGLTYTLSGASTPNLYNTGILESVITATSALVHFPLGSVAGAVNAAIYAVPPSSTASPVLVTAASAAQAGSIVVSLTNITGAQPTVGQLVVGLDFTASGSSNAPTLIGAYLTSINTSVTPTQYTISFYCAKADGTTAATTLAVSSVPALISFFNISVPVTALTGTPTLTTTSTYSTVTSVSQTDPNVTAGQLVTTSPTSLNLINSGLLTTASGKNSLSISYPTTSTAAAVQPSPTAPTSLYTFNPKAVGYVASSSGATTSSISITLSSISGTVAIGDMVVGITAVPLPSTTSQAAYVSAISGGAYTVTFVPALASNPSVSGLVGFFPSSVTGTSTYASVQYLAWSNFVYLDQTERDWFAKEKQDLLITQVQRINIGNNPVQELALAQPVKFIAFPCVNYSSLYANGTNSAAAVNYQLKTQVNGVDVGDSRHMHHWVDVPQYYNTPWGYMHNNQIANVAIISYCLDTSKLQPTGTLNFSRLDNFRLVVPSGLAGGVSGLAGPVNYTNQYLYAVNYNIFRIQNGLGSLLYSN